MSPESVSFSCISGAIRCATERAMSWGFAAVWATTPTARGATALVALSAILPSPDLATCFTARL